MVGIYMSSKITGEELAQKLVKEFAKFFGITDMVEFNGEPNNGEEITYERELKLPDGRNITVRYTGKIVYYCNQHYAGFDTDGNLQLPLTITLSNKLVISGPDGEFEFLPKKEPYPSELAHVSETPNGGIIKIAIEVEDAYDPDVLISAYNTVASMYKNNPWLSTRHHE